MISNLFDYGLNMPKKSYYQILGVAKDASEKEIQRAFRRLARKCHPDVNPGQQDTAERFKEINEAYQVLSDPDERKRYDINGRGFRFAGPITWHFESGGFSGGSPFDAGMNPFDEILDSLLGGRGEGPFRGAFGGRRSPRIEHPIEVTLEEAFHGATRVIELADTSVCRGCGGMGGACVECGGTGLAQRPRRLEIKVPPGVRTGSRIRVNPNRGRGGSGGVEDVYLILKVRPHQRIRREGDDLYVEVPVSLSDAVLGGEVRVETLGGNVELKIPPATQNGRSFRLKGQGMPALTKPGAGDLYATVKVSLPADLSEEELALFRKLRELRDERGVE